jgi:hypothetical protein
MLALDYFDDGDEAGNGGGGCLFGGRGSRGWQGVKGQRTVLIILRGAEQGQGFNRKQRTSRKSRANRTQVFILPPLVMRMG